MLRSRRAQFWTGSLLVLALVLVVGIVLPNRQPQRVNLFWLWQDTWPLWGLLFVCVLGGALISGLMMVVVWRRERLGRRSAEKRVAAIEAEVDELRRLVARDADTTDMPLQG